MSVPYNLEILIIDSLTSGNMLLFFSIMPFIAALNDIFRELALDSRPRANQSEISSPLSCGDTGPIRMARGAVYQVS